MATPGISRVVVSIVALAMIPVAIVTRPTPVLLEFYFSPDAAGVLEPAIAAFNDEHDGAVKIVGHGDVSSGKVEGAVASGDLQPEMWMPASSIWGELLGFDSERDPVPPVNPSFFYSPEVFATWPTVDELVKEAFGAPMGWETLARLNELDLRYGDKGPLHDVSPFRFGHTRPTTSTSGLYGMVSEYAAALETPPASLVASDGLRRPDVEAAVRGFELSVRNYGDVASDFCGPLADYAEQNYSALFMQETTLQKCRTGGGGAPKAPNLIEVYPSEGSFVADYPLIIFDAAWVSPQERSASLLFRDWLGEHLSVDAVHAQFLRAGSPWDDVPDPPPPEAEGIKGTLRILPIPEDEVLAQARDGWSSHIRKIGSIVMLLDHSGNMSTEGRWATSCDMLRAIVRGLDPQTVAGLVWFDDHVTVEVEPDRIEKVTVQLVDALDPQISPATTSSAKLSAGGWTASHMPEILDQESIDILLVVSTGKDDSSEATKTALKKRIGKRADFRSPIQVFTVFVGNPAGSGDEQLDLLAEEGRGTAWSLTGPEAVTPDEVVEAILSLVPTRA